MSTPVATPVAGAVDRIITSALGTTAVLAVTDPEVLPTAELIMRSELAAIDAACSRFRADSEISLLHQHPGVPVAIGPLLAEALDVALEAAERTGGLVDPTVGAAVRGLGYDRDFAELILDEPAPPAPVVPIPGWWRVRLDAEHRTVVLPRGVHLDLGATAKALAADRIAGSVAFATGAGVLVSLGGDDAVAGPPPDGDWPIAVGDDHERALTAPDAVVTIGGGGLASSGTTRRTWRRAGRTLHHIVDPRTGDAARPYWRTVTVAAASCVDANTASTAAIVLGPDAPGWLADRDLPARLVAADGAITTVAGFPAAEER
jgi:thiamine biosynthesis lipoprotein